MAPTYRVPPNASGPFQIDGFIAIGRRIVGFMYTTSGPGPIRWVGVGGWALCGGTHVPAAIRQVGFSPCVSQFLAVLAVLAVSSLV